MTGVPHDLDLGGLLAEQNFVRRLARGLVFDATDAEDVAQQTWLAALRQPLRRPHGARPFLARLTQRVASNWKRGESRRRRREQEAPPAEPVPSVDDAFARESLRQQVVAELAALTEPYRSTLVLRFFEDLTPIAIARQQGVPDATVRARLKRGLDALRTRLDQRYGGDRSAWCTALLPLTEAGRDVAPLTVVGAASVFGLHKLLWPAVGLLALLATAWWATSDAPAATLAGEGGAPPPALTVASIAAPAPTRARVPVPSTALSADVADADDAKPNNGLRGRLVLPDGTAAAGRTVRVLGVDSSRLFEGDLDDLAASVPITEADTESDQAGLFELRDLRPRALLVLQAGCGTKHSAYVPVAHTPGPDQVVDLGDIVLEARGTVIGRVENADGEPVADAEVWAASVPVVITLAANFERFSPAQGGMLLLPKLGTEDTASTIAARTRSYLGRDLFMQPQALGDDTTVHVVDTPAWVDRLWHALPIARTTTDPDGSFRLDDVAPGVGMLAARCQGLSAYVKGSLKVTAGQERDVGTLTLSFGETCRGTVRDHEGRPVAAAAVRVAALPAAGFRGLAFSEAEVKTARDGTFAVRGMNVGRALIAVRRASDEPWTTLGPVDVLDDVDVQLPPPAALRVHLSKKVAGASVRLSHGPGVGELLRMGMRTAIDTRARVRVEDEATLVVSDLVPSTYLLEVGAPGHVTARQLVSVPGAVTLELGAAAAPFEILVTSSTNAPLAGARVRCAAQQPDLARRVLPTYFGMKAPEILPTTLGCTDARGLVRVHGMRPGPLTIWADHPAHGRAEVRVELPAQRVLLRLPLAATLQGFLYEDGQPASAKRWRIAVVPQDLDDLDRPYALAAPGPDGSFKVTGLEPGPHRVVVHSALPPRLDIDALKDLMRSRIFSFFDNDEARSRDVVLREGEVRELRLDTDAQRDPPAAPGRVAGRVLIDGAPAAGLTVRAVDSFGYRIDANAPMDRTAADGGFALEGMVEGIVWLAVASDDDDLRNVIARQQTTIAPNATTEVTLAVTTSRVSGRIVAPPNRSAHDAVVAGHGPNGTEFTARVGADGSFTSGRVAAGPWALDVHGSELMGPEPLVSVELAPGADVVDVTVPAQPRFHLLVTVEGAPPGEKLMVSVATPSGNASWMTMCDRQGLARFSALRAGTYHISIDEPKEMRGEVTLDGAALHEVVLSERGLTRK